MSARTIADFLGLRRNVVFLLMALVGMGLGEELWIRFVPKYLESLGAGVWVIGCYDAIKTWLGAVYAYPGGVVTDRWGFRRALTWFTLISILGYGVVALVPHWWGVLGASFLFLAWSGFSLPATFSLVGSSLSSRQYAMGIGVQAAVKRIPIVLGPILGGALIDHYGLIKGMRAGVLIAIFLGILTIVFQQQIRELPKSESKSPSLSLFRAVRVFDLNLKKLLLSDILVRFCERIPYAWIVIYCMGELHITATQFGVLTAVEMATAIVCFIPTARLADKYGREPFILATFIFFSLFPLSLLISRTFSWLVLAFVIRGLKEFGEPARKAMILSLSPEATRAQTIGAYYFIRDTVVTAGSFLGAFLWRMSPETNLLGAALAGLAGTFYYVTTVRPSSTLRLDAPPAS
jgi:MFS family permease